ncbi:MAG: transglycosylase SLT domain-containing protein, partial [Acidobacteriota bacterium]
GGPPAPSPWDGPAAELAAVGLGEEAACLYSHRFPSATPGALAWSARSLAAWGNGPAALTCGERLWESLGVPAGLLPADLLVHLLPAELTTPCVAAARPAGLSAAWLVGIIRRESRFDARARSAAGALGVAQVVPETARRLGVDPGELWDAKRSLGLAAQELARLSSRFSGSLLKAAAAYNAGETVVTTWQRGLGGSPGELVFAAAIPYRETGAYTLSVLEGSALARHLR